jgi:hypothetical protein
MLQKKCTLIELQCDLIRCNNLSRVAVVNLSASLPVSRSSVLRNLAQNMAVVFGSTHTHTYARARLCVKRLYHLRNETNESYVQEPPMHTCMKWCELALQTWNQKSDEDVCWYVAPCSSDGGGRKNLLNVDKFIADHAAQCSRRQLSLCSLQEPEISPNFNSVAEQRYARVWYW